MLAKKTSVFVFLTSLMIFCSGQVCSSGEKTIVFSTSGQVTNTLFKISEVMLTEAFQRMGYGFELKSYPPRRAPKAANSGTTDGDSHRIYSYNKDNKYPNLVRVEEPVQTIERCVFTKRDDITVSGWESLAPYRVLYVGGIVVDERGLDSGGVPKENRFAVVTVDSAFKMLASDRGDVAVTSATTGWDTIKLLKLQDSGIKRVGTALKIIYLYPYIHKKYAGLAGELANRLREMKVEGTYDRLLSEVRGKTLKN